jgi:hypothetical protein
MSNTLFKNIPPPLGIKIAIQIFLFWCLRSAFVPLVKTKEDFSMLQKCLKYLKIIMFVSFGVVGFLPMYAAEEAELLIIGCGGGGTH